MCKTFYIVFGNKQPRQAGFWFYHLFTPPVNAWCFCIVFLRSNYKFNKDFRGSFFKCLFVSKIKQLVKYV